MPAIVVTGGAGYIGSHICKRLSEAGYLPVTFDNLSTGHQWAVKWGPLVKASILDREALSATLAGFDPLGVIHAAALSDVAQSVRCPGLYLEHNVEGTKSVLEVFDGVPIVFSSSAAVYGNPEGPVTEDRKPEPINPYGQSKLECEAMSPQAMRLRYFNVAGAEGDIGECKEPATHLIGNVLRAAKTGGVVEINGDGSAVRDFVDVRDVAEANLLALRALFAGVEGRALNISTGTGHSVLDVVRAAARVTGKRIGTTHTDARPGDASSVVGVNYFASDIIDWRPEHPLTEQIASAWEWINRG